MTGPVSTAGHRPGRVRRLLRAVLWVLLGLIVFDIILIVLFRLQWRPGIEAIMRFNKRILNPAMMRYAGRPHFYASVVHHVGRKSGNEYATPVWVVPSGEFFYTPLPYGIEVDWCQNILEAGRCVVESHGVVYDTVAPMVVSAESAAEYLPFRERTRFGVYGVDHYLRLQKEAEPVVAKAG